MKVKSLMMVALGASMMFASCSNDDEGVGAGQGTKGVSLSLANVEKAVRGADQPVATETLVKLNQFQVFFAGGSALYNGKDVNGSATSHYFTKLDDFNAQSRDKVFHYLPNAVGQVIVVGNENQVTVADDGTTTTTALAKTLNIGEQQNDENLYLYGESNLGNQQGTDKNGHPLFKATVNLAPRVSRIEIASFTYNQVDENTPRQYKSIEIDQVLFNNYYPTADGATGAASGTKLNETISKATAFNVLANAGTGWFNDKFSTAADADAAKTLKVITLAENTDNAAANYKYSYPATDVRPAYHFFPNVDGIDDPAKNHPQLVIKLVGTLENGTKVPLYLATKGFSTKTSKEMAKNYVLDFAFDDNDLGNPEKCVEVAVTVAKWLVVNVTPEF